MKKNSLMEGAIIATLAIIVSKILGILYVIPFHSLIGEKGGALYGYAYNIYNIFIIISSAGIPLAISKITSEYITKGEDEKKEEMFYLAKKIITIFAVASFLICFIFASPLAKLIIGDLEGGNSISDVCFVIRCVSFALLIVPFLSISRGYLQGHKYIRASSISQVIEQLIRIIVILIGSYILIKVLKVKVLYAVGISVFAACIGAIFSFIYLKLKTKTLLSKKSIPQNTLDKKEIIKKIIGYSLPFIIVNLANSLYNTTDMILLIKGLNILKYDANDIEIISSIFTTWGSKINSIVTAFATGLTVSLIPSLVNAYVKEDKKEVSTYFNKVLQVLFFIILPFTIFLSIFSTEVWNVFYGESFYGPIIMKYTILVAFLDSFYLLMGSSLQGIYKTKLIYIMVFAGLFVNLTLDLPFMLLFHKAGHYAFYGAILATVVGYIVSLSCALYYLIKKEKINIIDTLKKLPRLFVSIILLIAICLLINYFIPSFNKRIFNILYLAITGIICLVVYYLINKNTLNEILIERIKKKVQK